MTECLNKMMVMEVNLANIAKYYTKHSEIVANISGCFCDNNNNNNNNNERKMFQPECEIFEQNNKECVQIKKEIKKEEVMAIRTRFPNKIPVIVQKYWKENQLPQLDKSKFLVPKDITMSQFQTIIRNRMQMGHNQALYLLINEKSMLSASLTLAEVYSEHASPNGFLHITYASQEVFGGSNDEKIIISC